MNETNGDQPKRLILGSGSPRRLELLAQLGCAPNAIRPPDIDETPKRGELPKPYCARIASEKAQAIELGVDEVVLCADTTVAIGRRILGKPEDIEEARKFLLLMSGRRHKVITSIVVRDPTRQMSREVVTVVKMKQLSPAELDAYLETGDWAGKAGGYGIQGPASAFIPWIQGSYSGVVGLPLSETADLLRAAGIRVQPT